MATVQRYVNTGSTPGGDGTTNNTFGTDRAYASLSEWEANAGGVATDQYIVDCCGTVADTTSVVINTAVNVGSSGSILIRGNRLDPAGFYTGPQVISPDHYRLAVNMTGFSVLDTTNEINVTVDGIQVEATRSVGASGFAKGIAMGSVGSHTRNCRVRSTDANTYIGIGNETDISGTTTRNVENNLVVGFRRGIRFSFSNIGYTYTMNVLHNTIYGGRAESESGIILDGNTQNSASATFNVKGNVIAYHSADDISVIDLGTANVVNSADNATEDATGQITGIVPADVWTGPGILASSDFTIKDTGVLFNAVNPTLLITDITGFTRDGANHDIGAFEYQTGGGGQPAVNPFESYRHPMNVNSLLRM